MPASESDLIVTPALRIPLSELRFQMSRSSGPGGQNVNKVNTRVQVWWDVEHSTILQDDVRQRFLKQNANRITKEGRLLLESQEFRTQLANRKACLDELGRLVRLALVRPKKRRPTKPTRGSQERRLKAKKEKSQRKSERRFRPGSD
ncbi:MAG: alternative ribosome rescue aminoacyl-tRNA hydrolase ArfB [Planctomycetaceae bacterium]